MSHIRIDTHPEAEATPCNRLADALAVLSPISRRVIELWLEGLNASQIAVAVGLYRHDVAEIGLRAIQQVSDLLARSGSDRNQVSPADPQA